ncbi:MAG: hypothetical protein ACD_83C00031G0002 [uncultured bacterium]|uniref:Uncharacterized protein n=1 Tax=Berkelbacteria bacterium GW2011_GWA2_35_9 TaxID=1618333 RepID=A0A0G0FMA9_9BACT|nr:MAG: hypothetical protein ACD_83C00031G0002 [uncultured bacterium]KKP88565.1 MAG: hypothetical protein UR93_C0011G0013 [Berkelbacteria bacterium GW2011_GWA2_35_9]
MILHSEILILNLFTVFSPKSGQGAVSKIDLLLNAL